MKTFIYFLFTSLLTWFSGFCQQTGTLRGTVKESVTEAEISNAKVQIVGTDMAVYAGENGDFTFENVPVGRLELEISSVGFGTQRIKELLLVSNKDLMVHVQLEPSATNLDEIEVKAASPNLSGAVTSMQSITIEQVMRYPATFFDPARLAFSFSGVANNNDQANGMSIRGNNPRGLQWRLEGLEIVNPNHLANAGTFSDQATVNAGGTNMLSAQMLGNMNFLTGAFPAEYGNALSGVMDMRLRKGNNKEYEHTVQAGLIGLDLSSEGPLNKKKGSSYLINYRYSFTGLLALGGINFGGETIKFQDLAVNLSFPNKKLGDVTIFGMGGKNSNEFIFDDEDGTGPKFEKDLYTINYYGKMGAAGMTHAKNFNKNLLWKNALVYSGLQNERMQMSSPTSSLYTVFQYDINSTSKLSLSSILSGRVSANSNWKAGVYLTRATDSLSSLENNRNGIFSGYIVQPFAQYSQHFGSKINLTLGLHQMTYTLNNTATLEPRGSLTYNLDASQTLSLALGRHSQLFSSWLYAGNKNLKPTFSDQVVLHYVKNIGTSALFSAEAYGQFIHNDLASRFTHLAGVNITNFVNPAILDNSGKARNMGIELNYNKYLDNGFSALVNTSLYKSEYLAGDGQYYEAKYSGNYIFNVTLGKEWEISKSRVLGLNTRIVYLGGFRDYQIDLAESEAAQKTVFDYNAKLTNKKPAYFRPDIRAYLKRSKAKVNQMWSVDIQNLAAHQNVAYDYYDAFQKKIIRKYQLGLLPMLNYRIEF